VKKIQSQTIKEIIPANNNRIKYFGRWNFFNSGEVETSWGGAYIKLKFKGTKCKIILYDGNNDFEYSIDDKPNKLLITESNINEYELAANLADGEHTLIFARRSHCLNGKTVLKGFVKENFELIDNIAVDQRKIEFIGDSITAGCLNDSKNFKQGKPEIGNRHNENTNMAFGAVLSRKLNAEYSIIAIGGIGLYHNWMEKIPGIQKHIQDYFLLTDYFSPKIKWDFSLWQPDAVVVAIGTNDFGSDPIPDEKTYTDLYTDFIKLIRDKYKNAFIFCIGPFKYEENKKTSFDDCREYIKKAVKKINDKKIISIDPVKDGKEPWLKNGIIDYAGDDTHPLISGHIKIANRLEPVIKKYLNW